ncbi:MAG: anti-sigma factor [Phycisphaerales bacterium]|nr:anti-sigma factor [Phycisphaerales bacterium]
MSEQARNNPKWRLHELLADRAMAGITADESRELDALLRDHPVADADSFELAAAAAHLALSAGSLESMPAEVFTKIELAGRDQLRGVTRSPESSARSTGAAVRDEENVAARAGRIRAWGVAGWMAAAACLTLAISSWLSHPVQPGGTGGVVMADPTRAHQILGAKPTAVKMPWSPSPTNDPAGQNVAGEVVWDTATGTGSIKLAGLAPNDPAKNQYQLWVFTEAGLESHPVDGGVFDTNQAGAVTVPIDANLRGTTPAIFAITLERPGGVRVSDRSRLVALAKVPG